MHHRQGDYTDIGNKASHPAQTNNISNNKKMLDIQDQHSSRYDDSSKKLGSTPKICQIGILTNNGNGMGSNTKSENHPYNNNRIPHGKNTLEYLEILKRWLDNIIQRCFNVI